MWKTVVVSVTLAVILTAAIGAGVIRATSDRGSAASPAVEPPAQSDTLTTTDNPFQPTFSGAALNTDPMAPPAAQVDDQAVEEPAPPADEPDADEGAPPPPADTPEPEDTGWGQMRQHMDAMHGEGSFDSMLDHMGGGMMGDGSGAGMTGGGSGGGMTGGGSGGGMMSW